MEVERREPSEKDHMGSIVIYVTEEELFGRPSLHDYLDSAQFNEEDRRQIEYIGVVEGFESARIWGNSIIQNKNRTGELS